MESKEIMRRWREAIEAGDDIRTDLLAVDGSDYLIVSGTGDAVEALGAYAYDALDVENWLVQREDGGYGDFCGWVDAVDDWRLIGPVRGLGLVLCEDGSGTEVPPLALTDVLHSDSWGVEVTVGEHHDACARMEARLTDTEGPGLSISVRPSRPGEVEGLFYGDGRTASPDDREAVRDLLDAAWQHACETWPTQNTALAPNATLGG